MEKEEGQEFMGQELGVGTVMVVGEMVASKGREGKMHEKIRWILD